MKSHQPDGLLEFVRAVEAGRRVDWATVESSGSLSESLSALLRELKVVDEIAEVHRSLPLSPGANQRREPSSNDVSSAHGTPEPKTTWGVLHLLDRIGHGAFGDVYRAWDPRLDREVALKLLKQTDSRDDSVGSLVIDEGRLLAKIRHQNVVTIYGADRVDGRVGLWMEFVRGRTIEAVLRQHGPFGPQEAALIGLDLCRALSAVHRAGVVHRDIKAQNVVREAGGRLVLMDFGTGREMMESASAELAGTPLYLAPEVFEGAVATRRSDIYSVGVLLYYLVTGVYPVRGRTISDLREAHRARRRFWLGDERPDLPDAFIKVVERALEVDPNRRFESAGALEAALAGIVSTPQTSADMGRRPSAEAVAAPRRLRWLTVAAAAISLVATAALFAPSWREKLLGGPGPPPVATRPLTPAMPSAAVMRRIPLAGYSFVGSPSPDGKLFSLADENGNVAVLDLSTGQVRPVTHEASYSPQGSQFAQATAIAHDGSLIAYGWVALDGQFEIRVVDLEGAHPRVLLRDASIDYGAPIQWSRDGKSILALLAQSGQAARLALISVEAGESQTVKELGAVWPQYASLSPDGAFVVYDAPQQPGIGVRDIFIVGSDGSNPRTLVGHVANDAQPVWTPDGQRVLFTSDRSGSNDVWSATLDHGVVVGEPELVHRNVGRMWLRGLTDTGAYFFHLTAGVVDVYEAKLSEAGVSEPSPLPTTYAGSNISSIWSPDGRSLAYASRRGTSWFDVGSTTLAIRDIHTHEQRELAPAMKGFLLRSWSRDGRAVLVQGTGVDQQQGMYEIDVDTGHVRPVLVGGTTAWPDWRPDGSITYLSRRTHAIVARDPRSGTERTVFDPRTVAAEIVGNVSGRGFRLSPDGQTLAFTLAAGSGERATSSLLIEERSGTPPRELVRVAGPESMMFQDWTPDGEGLLFTRSSPETTAPTSLWRVSIHGGDPQPIGLSMIGLRDVSVHPDGTRITFTAGWPSNEVWVMDNFLHD